MTNYYPRDIAQMVNSALENMPVVMVTGMRQTGKTTFLCSESGLDDRHYVSFDDFAQLDAAQRNPEALLQGDDPITIDEVQRCPELLISVKKAVDEHRVPGRFLLSGSANLLLLKGVVDLKYVKLEKNLEKKSK